MPINEARLLIAFGIAMADDECRKKLLALNRDAMPELPRMLFDAVASGMPITMVQAMKHVSIELKKGERWKDAVTRTIIEWSVGDHKRRLGERAALALALLPDKDVGAKLAELAKEWEAK